MNTVEQVLAFLEGDETQKIEKVREQLHIQSARNARVVLHILETSPEKYIEKVGKEVHKLEEKIDKEYKKAYRKMNSYTHDGSFGHYKIAELKAELTELKQLL